MRRLAELGIVGAGPAGARAAELLAAQGADAVLLDPDAPWEKPCGGGLTSTLFDEVPELAELQPLARPVHVARVELASGGGFDVELERPIWIVAREDLGRWQLDRAIRAGAGHVSARVKAIERVAEGWNLDTDDGMVAVQTLVGADGASSLVRRATGCGLRLAPLATRVEYPLGVDADPAVLVLRFYPGIAGYLWDFPRPGHRSVGMEVPAGTASRAVLDAALDTYLASGEWAGGAPHARRGAAIGTAPFRRGRFARLAGSGFALVGDAAGLADPFTGEGIRNAFRSAALLAAAYSRDDPRWPSRYARSVRRELGSDLAAASLLRHVLAETPIGVTLVEWATSSDGGYAFVAAILDALAGHRYGARAFARRWMVRRRSGRRLRHQAGSQYGEPATTRGVSR